MDTLETIVDTQALNLSKTPSEVAISIVAFFDRPEWQEVIEIVTDRDGGQTEQKSHRRNPMPLLEEWCMRERITKSMLLTLIEDSEEVAQAVEYARMVMKKYLIHNGLDGTYDARMVTFVASNETDMKIKSEIENRNPSANDVLAQIEAGEMKLVAAPKKKSHVKGKPKK